MSSSSKKYSKIILWDGSSLVLKKTASQKCNFVSIVVKVCKVCFNLHLILELLYKSFLELCHHEIGLVCQKSGTKITICLRCEFSYLIIGMNSSDTLFPFGLHGIGFKDNCLIVFIIRLLICQNRLGWNSKMLEF